MLVAVISGLAAGCSNPVQPESVVSLDFGGFVVWGYYEQRSPSGLAPISLPWRVQVNVVGNESVRVESVHSEIRSKTGVNITFVEDLTADEIARQAGSADIPGGATRSFHSVKFPPETCVTQDAKDWAINIAVRVRHDNDGRTEELSGGPFVSPRYFPVTPPTC
jgi:hypothetical protein